MTSMLQISIISSNSVCMKKTLEADEFVRMVSMFCFQVMPAVKMLTIQWQIQRGLIEFA